MGSLAKKVLKRPVTTVLVVLCLIFFGGMSLLNQKLELIPEINMPMLIITTVYPGAGPEDVAELVTKPIEEEVNTLSGVDTMTSSSSENMSLVLLQYDYGTDMDNAYTDLRKRLDLVLSGLPEDVQDPNIIEMDINQMASMYLNINNKAVDNVYNYATDTLEPELEKLSAVASVDVSGGSAEYVSIELIPEKLEQYNLDISTVASLVGSSFFTMPSGDTSVGSTDLNVSSGVEYNDTEDLKRIPITVGSGDIIYLEDIALVTQKEEDPTAVGRYNGQDTVMLGINRNQEYTDVDVSRQVTAAIEELQAEDPNLEINIINDNSESIISSLESVMSTMAMAVIISMAILFIFFGDIKASLIVGTSIPISILSAFVMMWAMGYSLNVITMSSIVLGVGMMVDNSIVVIESCFRAMKEDKSFNGYAHAAVRGTEVVGSSVLGSTLTTCVVFLPLAFLSGLSGQFFQPLGMTIVFCMTASLISAVTIVPLCYVFYKPQENAKSPAYKFIRALQNGYRHLMEKILRHKALAMGSTIALFIVSISLLSGIRVEMMPATDEGTIQVSIVTKPDLKLEEMDKTLRKVEEIIMEDSDLDSYMLTSGSGLSMGTSSGTTSSITAYLKDDREKSTKETVKIWRDKLQAVDNCDISVEDYSTTSSMAVDANFNVTLLDADYDELKEASDKITDALMQRPEVTNVNSTLANSSPLVKVDIDPVAAAAEGFVPAQLAQSVNAMVSGVEADDAMDIDGKDYSVMVEFPKERYSDINQLENIMVRSSTGTSVLLKDVADVHFEDSPSSITRENKQYQVQITAEYTEAAGADTMADLYNNIVRPNITGGISEEENAMTEMMNEELGNLGTAIAIAVFLVFVVMAAQFESYRFSFMVMTTIPFALIGSFGLLWLFDVSISMPAMIGFLMLVGTVVNNGILYVDTANQLREENDDLKTAVIEAGAIRLRPILMTTLTTVVSMVPMATGYGDNGALMQGLAMVDVGGLCTSTVLALLIIPIYYMIMYKKKPSKFGRQESQGKLPD